MNIFHRPIIVKITHQKVETQTPLTLGGYVTRMYNEGVCKENKRWMWYSSSYTTARGYVFENTVLQYYPLESGGEG